MTILNFLNFAFTNTSSSQRWIKQISFGISLFFFILSIFAWIYFDPFQINFQYLISCKFFTFNFYMGLDALSLFFIYLTAFLIPLCILFNWNNIYHSLNNYVICILSLEILLILVFSVLDLLLFYIFFESILIPIFVFIAFGVLVNVKFTLHIFYFFILYLVLY
jgi:NADH-ubiquinone oxidoreductase chain 4